MQAELEKQMLWNEIDIAEVEQSYQADLATGNTYVSPDKIYKALRPIDEAIDQVVKDYLSKEQSRHAGKSLQYPKGSPEYIREKEFEWWYGDLLRKIETYYSNVAEFLRDKTMDDLKNRNKENKNKEFNERGR